MGCRIMIWFPLGFLVWGGGVIILNRKRQYDERLQILLGSVREMWGVGLSLREGAVMGVEIEIKIKIKNPTPPSPFSTSLSCLSLTLFAQKETSFLKFLPC